MSFKKRLNQSIIMIITTNHYLINSAVSELNWVMQIRKKNATTALMNPITEYDFISVFAMP